MQRAVAAALALASTVANADDAQEVHVAGDSRQRPDVTNEDIDRAQALDAAEMLRRVAGVQVRSDPGGGNRFDVGMRGTDPGRSRHVVVLEDGVPLAANPYSQPDMLYAPPIERMQTIDVTTGTGTVAFGPRTTAGTIQFRTIALPSARRVVLDASGGSYGYGRALALYGDKVGDTAYLVQGLFRHSDGPRAMERNQGDVLGKLGFPTGPRGKLVLKLGTHIEDEDSDGVGMTNALYAQTPRRDTVAPNDRLQLQRLDASVTHEQRFAKATSLRTLVYAYWLGTAWRRQDFMRAPIPGMQYEHIAGDLYFPFTNTILRRSYGVTGLEPTFAHAFSAGRIQHRVTVSGRLLLETSSDEQGQGDDPTSFAGTQDYRESHVSFAAAGYLADVISLSRSLVVTPRFRYEHAHYTRTIERKDSGSGPTDVHVTGDTNVDGVVPAIDLAYTSRHAMAFAGANVAWSPPRLAMAVSPLGAPTQTAAEMGTTYEVGSRLNVRGASAGIVSYVSLFQNQIVAAGNGLVDGGPTRTVGFETDAGLAIGRVLGFPFALDLRTHYTFSRATFAVGPNAGNLLPYAPQHTIVITLSAELRFGLGAEVAYRFVSDQLVDAANTRTPDSTGTLGLIGSRNVVDFMVRYRHRPSGLSIQLAVKNATDDVGIDARRPQGIFVMGFRSVVLGLRFDR